MFTAKTSATSIIPALIACTSSPMPGTSTTTVTSAKRRNLDFVLPHADGLDQYQIVSGCIEQQRQFERRRGQAAHAPARRHRSKKHSRVGMMLLHADAVAEDRAG